MSVDAAADELAIVRVDEIEHRPAEQRLARFVAEEGHEGGIGIGDRAVGERAVREHAVGGALDELLVVGERAALRLDDAHFVGDVAADREAHVSRRSQDPLQDSLRDELRAVLAAMPRGVEGRIGLLQGVFECRHAL